MGQGCEREVDGGATRREPGRPPRVTAVVRDTRTCSQPAAPPLAGQRVVQECGDLPQRERKSCRPQRRPGTLPLRPRRPLLRGVSRPVWVMRLGVLSVGQPLPVVFVPLTVEAAGPVGCPEFGGLGVGVLVRVAPPRRLRSGAPPGCGSVRCLFSGTRLVFSIFSREFLGFPLLAFASSSDVRKMNSFSWDLCYKYFQSA